MANGNLNVSLILKLIDQVTAPARAVTGAMRGIERVTEQTGRAGIDMANRQLAMSQARRGALQGEAFGVAAVGGALAASLKPAIDFERSMAEVGAISRANEEDLDRMTASARALGATTPWAASEAAQGMRFLAMAGFEVNETIAAMPGILNLASAGSTDLGRTSDIASNILSGFRLEAAEMARVGDVLTNTFTSSNTDLNMLGETMKYVAPNAAELGMSIEQTAAMVGLLGNAGIQGSNAGTAMRAMLTRLAALPKPAQEALNRLGVQSVDTQGNLRELPTVLAEINQAMDGLGSGDRAALVSDIFGMEAASSATVLLAEAGSGALQEYIEQLRETGSAARVAAALNDNTAGALKRLQSIAESAAITLGTVVLPEVVSLVETLIPVIGAVQAWAEANPELVATIIRVTAGLVAFRLGSIALQWGLLSLLDPVLKLIRFGSGLLVLLPRLAGALRALLNPLALVRGAMVALRVAILSTGIGALLAGVAMAGVWIYNNWSGLGAFFTAFWEDFSASLGATAPFLNDLADRLGDLWQWITNLLGPVEASTEQWAAWGQEASQSLQAVLGWIGQWTGLNSDLLVSIGGVWAGWLAVKAALMVLPLRAIGAFGRTVLTIAQTALPALLAGLRLLRGTLLAVGRAALTNPIGLTITAVAGLAYAVYDNWDRIVGYVQDKIDTIRAAFDQGLIQGVLAVMEELDPFALMMDGAKGLLAWIMELMGVPEQIVAEFRAFSLFDAGVDLLQSLWDGMASMVPRAVAAITAQLSKIKPQWLTDLQNWASVGQERGPRPLPGRDRGGPVRPGQAYQVGERMAELFVPDTAGQIIPGQALLHVNALADRLQNRLTRIASMAAVLGATAGVPALADGGDVAAAVGLAQSAPDRVTHRTAPALPAKAAQGQTLVREGDTITIHVQSRPGQDPEEIARAVARELNRRDRDRGAALDDGVDYG